MALKKRLRELTKLERTAVAEKAQITSESLRLIAGGHRVASIDVAERLESILGIDSAEELVSAESRKLMQRLKRRK